MKTLLTIFLRVCVLASLWAGTSSFAEAKKGTAKAPPPPVPRKLTVDQGQQVVVPLAVFGTGEENMAFLIRSGPKHGKVSAVRITGDKTAAVTYFAPEQTAATEDQFTYAVRTADGVSAAASVVIRIAEAAGLAPRLVVPRALELEAVRAGESSNATITIKNAGGGLSVGELSVPAPWRIEGKTKFRLEGGSSTEFAVSFSSPIVGLQKGDVTYGPGHRVSTTLSISVLPPITFVPALLELKAKPDATTRSAQVRLTNESAEPVMVGIKHAGKLLTEASVTIPARETKSLAVFAEPGETGSIQDKLQFTAGSWTGELPVISAALGALVSCREKAVAFSAVTVDRVAQSNITVENAGGTAVALTFTAGGPFSTDPTSIALKPKSTASIAVLCRAETPGALEGKLSITGNGVQLDLPLTAQASASATSAPPSPPVAEKPRVAPAPVRVEEERTAVSLAAVGTAAEVPGMLGKVSAVTPKSATIEWTSTLKPGLRVQQRILSVSAGSPVITWRDVAAKFQQVGAVMHCEIGELSPSTVQTYRILAGDSVECTVNVITPARPPILPFGLQSTVLTLLGAAAAWLLWKRWKMTARSGW